jgi:pyruvate-ferredoxin/flavodoxin oxidoreductase
MAAFGKDQHGKEEVRKEMGLIAMAHRGTYVLQSSQASPTHLLGGVIKGLQSRRPAVFILHCPCPPEHGLGDDQATQAARLSLESRAFPFIIYDPDGGETMAERLDLEGNPSVDDRWPEYELKYVDEEGAEQMMELPLTIADWAATEARFKKHFKKLPAEVDEEELVPFAEYLDVPKEERNGQRPYIYVIDAEKRLKRLSVSDEIVELAEDRLLLWEQLKEMAGLKATDEARLIVEGELEEEFEKKAAALRGEYEAKLADLRTKYPQVVARRLAEGLLRAGDGTLTVADLLTRAESTPGLQPLTMDVSGLDIGTAPAGSATATAAAPAEAPAVEEEEG